MKHSLAGLVVLLCTAASTCRADADGLPIQIDAQGSNIRVPGAVLSQVASLGRSFQRDAAIDNWIRLLQVPDRTSRVYAAWCLGHVQAERAVKALFAAAGDEEDRLVLRMICESIYGEFAGQLPGEMLSDPNRIDFGALIQRWRRLFDEKGYAGLFHEYLVAALQNEASLVHLLHAMGERYDPQLAPFLLEAYDNAPTADTKAYAADLVLCWSGFDLSVQSSEQIRERLALPGELDSALIGARYEEFFGRRGFVAILGGRVGIASAVLLTSKNERHREMALRLLTLGMTTRSGEPVE